MRPRELILFCLAGLVVPPSPARAQCTSNASSCVTCHEARGARPILQSTQPWHVDHGFGDLCAACHAGDPGAVTQAAAHVGLRQPLSDPASACAGCHDDDALLAERYLAAVSVPSPARPSERPSPSPSAPAGSMANRILAMASLLLGGAIYVALRRRRARTSRRLSDWLRDKTWSPYAAGVLLGLVVAFSEVVCGRPLGVAGAFDRLAAYPGRFLFPSSQYYGHIMSPAITWQVWLVVGVLSGSFVSSKLSGEARWRWLPDTQWVPRFGPSRPRRLLVSFLGAALVQVGAAIAGGCTSGLAISGGAALAPGAFLFMAGMFAGGIPTAMLWYRGRGH